MIQPEDDPMDLTRFVEKWAAKLGQSMPRDGTHNYVAWCLLYMDEWGRSPYMTKAELDECARDYLEIEHEACSSVTHQARHVLRSLESDELAAKLERILKDAEEAEA